jgi:integrase
VLALYVRDIGPSLSSPETLAYAVKALSPFWGSLTCDAVKGSTSRAYTRWRERPEEREYVGKMGGRWKRRLAAKPGTIRRELGVLQRALNYAVAEGALIYAPTVTLPKAPKSGEHWRTREEIAALLRKSAPHVRRFILIAVTTGRRETAILELRWTPSLTSGSADMEREVIHFLGEAEDETAKRRGSVKMTRGLAAHMRRWAREGGSHVIMWRGKPIEEIDTALAAASRRAGIRRVTPHELKHTAVTWAFQRGMSLEDASDWFDTTPATLLKYYRAHSPHHQARAKAIMERK